MAISFSAPMRNALARIPRPSYLDDITGDDTDPAGTTPVVVVNNAPAADTGDGVPQGLRMAAGWAWRVMVLGAFVLFAFKTLHHIEEVVIPLIVALLFTAVFWPMRDSLVRHRVKPVFAALLSLVLLLLVVLGILSLVSVQIASQSDNLADEAVTSFNKAVNWLETGPFHVTNGQLDSWLKQATDYVSSSRSKIAGYATTVGSSVTHFFAGLALTLFAMFYFLNEGRRLANSLAVLLPSRSRERVMNAATKGWFALVAYVRAAVIVAGVDGAGALVGAFFLGSNMWLAIGALTFLCAFIPLVGAIISGAIAVSVVFVTLGPLKALIMLLVFVFVTEFEGHVLQPFLLGKAVSIHPLVVLYGIAIGMIVDGIVGALFMVPMMAFVNAFIRAWRRPMTQQAVGADLADDARDGDGGEKPAGVSSVEKSAVEASEVEHEPTEDESDPADPLHAREGSGTPELA